MICAIWIGYQVNLLLSSELSLSPPHGANKVCVFYLRVQNLFILPLDWILMELAFASLVNLFVFGTFAEYVVWYNLTN
jgi:hypothetical protein